MKERKIKALFKIACSIAVLVFLGVNEAYCQNSILDVGARVQKGIGLYTESGITVNYSDKNYAPDKLYLGFSYYTSRLGTALGSNAVKQDNLLISGAWYFRRNHTIRPLVKANLGYFRADYPVIFSSLPHHSLLASTETGICIQTHTPLKIATTFGYNLIYGQGNNNTPGTLYPFFYQLTVSWNILKPAR